MKWNEYLLVCLSEELAESAQEVGKCLRFTCQNKHPSKPHTNLKGLSKEFSQVIAVLELLKEAGINIEVDDSEIKSKKKRLLGFAERSKELGVLNDNSHN